MFLRKVENLAKVSPDELNKYCSEFFCLNYAETESKIIHKNSATYSLDILEEEALNTSWYDYYQMLKLSFDRKLTFLDVGAGSCRGSLLANALKYEHVTSVEIVSERVNHAKEICKRLNLKTNQLIENDITNVDLSLFDILFIYQPVDKLLTHVLDKMKVGSRIWAIESHGDLLARLSYDTRLESSTRILDTNSKRHISGIYEFKKVNNLPNDYIDFEKEFYETETFEIDENEFKWVYRPEVKYIDFIDETPFINLDNYRIDLSKVKLVNYELTYEVEKLLKMSYFDNQKILKVLTYPKVGLDLISSGRIYF